MLIDIVPS